MYVYIYIYTYISACVCVFVCVLQFYMIYQSHYHKKKKHPSKLTQSNPDNTQELFVALLTASIPLRCEIFSAPATHSKQSWFSPITLLGMEWALLGVVISIEASLHHRSAQEVLNTLLQLCLAAFPNLLELLITDGVGAIHGVRDAGSGLVQSILNLRYTPAPVEGWLYLGSLPSVSLLYFL